MWFVKDLSCFDMRQSRVLLQWTCSPGTLLWPPRAARDPVSGAFIYPKFTGHPHIPGPGHWVPHFFSLHKSMHFSFSLGFEMFPNKTKQNKTGAFFIWLIECSIQYIAIGKMSLPSTANSITQNKSLHLLSLWIGFPNGSNIYRNGPNCTNKP